MTLKPKKFFILATISCVIMVAFLGGFSLGQKYTYQKLGIKTVALKKAAHYPPKNTHVRRAILHY